MPPPCVSRLSRAQLSGTLPPPRPVYIYARGHFCAFYNDARHTVPLCLFSILVHKLLVKDGDPVTILVNLGPVSPAFQNLEPPTVHSSSQMTHARNVVLKCSVPSFCPKPVLTFKGMDLVCMMRTCASPITYQSQGRHIFQWIVEVASSRKRRASCRLLQQPGWPWAEA